MDLESSSSGAVREGKKTIFQIIISIEIPSKVNR